jgi:hypothetical protein
MAADLFRRLKVAMSAQGFNNFQNGWKRGRRAKVGSMITSTRVPSANSGAEISIRWPGRTVVCTRNGAISANQFTELTVPARNAD